ncbi:MAG: glycoside hydrolase family 5 protein [Fibrobacter sp.]|jgi:endoglucanase|nr:glycoside hydrolase family 5 protein [Fibrobacter sp.]
MVTRFFLLASFIFLLACSSKNPGTLSENTEPPEVSEPPFGVVSWTVSGGFFDPRRHPMTFQGVAFGNDVWDADEPNPDHHSEDDFIRMKEMGLNAIRFYLSYKFFEDDSKPYEYKQSGWDFLDRNLAWAEKHGIYLFLNMHVPQGGFQSNAAGGALWDNTENQNRVTALWYAIAERYKGNPMIAGYDLINEPVVTESKLQWQHLAQRLIDTIRTADTAHLIFVERINGIIGVGYDNDAEMNFVEFQDPYQRTGLTFHFYTPFEFTHQYASWTGLAQSDGGSYPDSGRIQISSHQWVNATHASPAAPSGNSDWKWYEGTWIMIADTAETNIARPTLVCKNVRGGTVRFDSLVVEKKDKDGNISRIAGYDLPLKGDWYFWMETQGGRTVTDESDVGITGTVSDANYAATDLFFALEQGASYRANGKMKGEDVPEGALCQVRLDLERTPFYSPHRDRSFLEHEVDRFYKVAAARKVPVFLGEFGAINYTMTEEKGGVRWVSDMLSIIGERRMAFTYHSWHEDAFGIFKGYGGPINPENANHELIRLFKNRFTRGSR